MVKAFFLLNVLCTTLSAAYAQRVFSPSMSPNRKAIGKTPRLLLMDVDGTSLRMGMESKGLWRIDPISSTDDQSLYFSQVEWIYWLPFYTVENC